MVHLYKWDPHPHRAPGRLGRVVRWGKRRSNFGDLLGPLVARRILARHGLLNPPLGRRLFTVGSVLHFARTGDAVWGTGRNGKVAPETHRFTDLEVAAVRGPLTAEFLRDRGIAAPDVHGDPGVLLADLFPEWASDGVRSGALYVPNMNDVRPAPDGIETLSPIGSVPAIVRRLASAELVVASSLHGVVVAEAYGVPARLVVPEHESLFKYRDHYAATGRHDEVFARSVQEALALGPSTPPVVDHEALLDAFPLHLWRHRAA